MPIRATPIKLPIDYAIFILLKNPILNLLIACRGNIIVALAEPVLMRNYFITLLVLVLLSTGLYACGNKGPLFIPEEDEKAEKTE